MSLECRTWGISALPLIDLVFTVRNSAVLNFITPYRKDKKCTVLKVSFANRLWIDAHDVMIHTQGCVWHQFRCYVAQASVPCMSIADALWTRCSLCLSWNGFMCKVSTCGICTASFQMHWSFIIKRQSTAKVVSGRDTIYQTTSTLF